MPRDGGRHLSGCLWLLGAVTAPDVRRLRELRPGCVELNGPVHATAATDAAGNYWFSGLPAGVYTVCETVQAGWHQTFPGNGPTCATGLGWSITVGEGSGNSFIWFGNLTP